jgi:predicted nucleotide-binding protein
MSTEREELVELLSAQRAELDSFVGRDYESGKWIRWLTHTRAMIRRFFGDGSDEFNEFNSTCDWWQGYYIGTETQIELKKEADFRAMVDRLKGWLEAQTSTIEQFGLPHRSSSAAVSTAPRIFIAHGPESSPLGLLVDFLSACGCDPIVVEKRPSQGRSVNENVEYYLDRSDCAVVLATGDELSGDRVLARPNVYIEIGRFQERFQDKVIYLVEENLSLPSNIAEKVYERFTQDNLTAAFIKVVNELRAFRLLSSQA